MPQSLFVVEPAWRNFFENPKLVQFTHRSFAYAIFLAAAWHAFSAARHRPRSAHARRALTLFLLVALQATIGIVTLLWQVPLGWGLAHQFTALLVLSFAAAHWRGTRGSYPLARPTPSPA